MLCPSGSFFWLTLPLGVRSWSLDVRLVFSLDTLRGGSPFLGVGRVFLFLVPSVVRVYVCVQGLACAAIVVCLL